MMTRVSDLRCFAVLLAVTVCALSIQAQDRSSVFQWWNEVQLIVPVVRFTDGHGKTVNKVTTIFSGVARVGRGEFIDGRLGVEMDFRAGGHVTLITSVLERTDELVDSHQHSEIRIAGGAIA